MAATTRRALGCFAMVLATASRAPAQVSWPERPVRLIAPFAPGGPSDVIARTLAEQLSRSWNQPVVVENRPGAGGNVGSDYVARQPPDGLTLVVAANTLVTAPALVQRLPFDPLRDFTPIALVAQHPHILVVHPSVPATTVAEAHRARAHQARQLRIGRRRRGQPSVGRIAGGVGGR